ncbi:hypothetical protein D4768_30340 (plasmid) [Rhodococcus erythropolis]|uniref:hypothetical protein n=1 Tax=Rhodococcus erythropolis TaxID=1833 RepID=UPI001F1F43CC|nr:hypothetical protein [Rhodococcus erythropolis]UJC82123.1 hypothetical protein D4768_30340 [Rhodococcus erythropolis]
MQDQVHAGVAGEYVVCGEFDYAGWYLGVQQHQGAGDSKSEVQVGVAQAPPQQGPALVVAEEVLRQPVAPEAGDAQVGGEVVGVRPTEEVPQPPAGGRPLVEPAIDIGLAGTGQVEAVCRARSKLCRDGDTGASVARNAGRHRWLVRGATSGAVQHGPGRVGAQQERNLVRQTVEEFVDPGLYGVEVVAAVLENASVDEDSAQIPHVCVLFVLVETVVGDRVTDLKQ